jgi:hypothetical protein
LKDASIISFICHIAIARRLSSDEGRPPWKTWRQALQEADDLLAQAIGDASARLKQHRAYLAAQLENAMRLYICG